MKITKIDVMLINPKSEDNPLWRPIGCRIYTDEGIYGDGEVALAFGVASTGAYGTLIDFSKRIIGKDPLEHEVIWEDLHKNTFWGQNGGPVIFGAISAIDVALWDIRAKYFKVPLYKLLGGKMREKLRTYASQLQFCWGEKKEGLYKTEDYAEVAKKAVSEGYTAVKFNFFTFDENGERLNYEKMSGLQSVKYLKMIEERVRTVREAVGEDIDIIMENHSCTDVNSAIQLMKKLEKYNIFFLEEPTTPSADMSKVIRDNINTPIAQGERIYTRWQYKAYFENNSIQVIQPDLGTNGGITETKKVCDMAHVYDVGVQIHVCSSPLLTAAALNLEIALPNFTIHEHHVYNLHEYNKKLCVYDYQPENGYFKVPERIGIGNGWSEYAFQNCELTTIEN